MPGRTKGFCPRCGQPFSFEPQLPPGTLVAGQYEVVGCLAHGGLGWIYLAQDRNVSDRWVVLKGLLNTGDDDALAAAIAEQRYLAQVSHPNIVKIFNFVTHDRAGYIVMEFVGGVSLRSLLDPQVVDGRTVYRPMPVDRALAYLVEVLAALHYLHDLGLLFCDLKPDNIIHVGNDVRLIDLGAVRRIGDEEAAIFGTPGYQAPEVAVLGPSIASDLYTVGRTLLVLTCEFDGFTSTYRHCLPPPDCVPALRDHDSFHRLLERACAGDPSDRFTSAEEMRAQAVGVQREVRARLDQLRRGGGLSAATGSAASALFEAPHRLGAEIDWRELPVARRDRADPGLGFLQTLPDDDLPRRLRLLRQAPSGSAEIDLDLARTALVLGDHDLVERQAAALHSDDPWDWRPLWISGMARLDRGDAQGSRAAFDRVYRELPGELAPKLALAFACERCGDEEVADALYAVCVRTDAGYVSAGAFGMARLRAGRDDVAGAISALGLVPPTSAGYPLARQNVAWLLLRLGTSTDLTHAEDVAAAAGFNPIAAAELRITLLEKALRMHSDGARVVLGGREASETDLRLDLEATLRGLARLTDDQRRRISLVDQANRVRPWTRT
jgi:serine/threonine-protein kinase PknG